MLKLEQPQSRHSSLAKSEVLWILLGSKRYVRGYRQEQTRTNLLIILTLWTWS